MALSDEERRARRRETRRRYEQKNPGRVRQWKEANREQVLEWQAQHRSANREPLAEAERQRNRDLREAVLEHYGRTCACCGSASQPAIDHVNGDGKQHREELFGRQKAGTMFYRWLIQQGFPDGFQTLCKPCNNSKGRGEQCRLSHQEVV